MIKLFFFFPIKIGLLYIFCGGYCSCQSDPAWAKRNSCTGGSLVWAGPRLCTPPQGLAPWFVCSLLQLRFSSCPMESDACGEWSQVNLWLLSIYFIPFYPSVEIFISRNGGTQILQLHRRDYFKQQHHKASSLCCGWARAEPLPFASQVWWWFVQQVLTKAAPVSAQMVCNAQCQILQVLPKSFPVLLACIYHLQRSNAALTSSKALYPWAGNAMRLKTHYRGEMHLHLGSCLSWAHVRTRASGGMFCC